MTTTEKTGKRWCYCEGDGHTVTFLPHVASIGGFFIVHYDPEQPDERELYLAIPDVPAPFCVGDVSRTQPVACGCAEHDAANQVRRRAPFRAQAWQDIGLDREAWFETSEAGMTWLIHRHTELFSDPKRRAAYLADEDFTGPVQVEPDALIYPITTQYSPEDRGYKAVTTAFAPYPVVGFGETTTAAVRDNLAIQHAMRLHFAGEGLPLPPYPAIETVATDATVETVDN